MYVISIIFHIIFLTTILNFYKNKNNNLYIINKNNSTYNLLNNKKFIWINYNKKNNLFYKYNKNDFYTISYIDILNNILYIKTLNIKNPEIYIKNEINNIFSCKNFYLYYKNNSNLNCNKNILNRLNDYSLIFNKIKKINIYNIKYIKNNLNIKIINKNIKINIFKIKLYNNKNIIYNDKYINKIIKLSNKYKLNYNLILSLIKIESNFNPYAISKSKAIGLMQITENAYKDTCRIYNNKKFLNNNINYLLNIDNNLNIGIKYINIIQNIYLKNIINKTSLRYLTIISYNIGINNTIKLFSKNLNDFIILINSNNSKFILNYIKNNNKNLYILKYLIKVNKFFNIYKNKKI